MDDDTLMRDRVRPKQSLRDRFDEPMEIPAPGKPAAGSVTAGAPEAPADAGPESYDPSGKDYKAYGWGGHRTLPSLRLILKDQSERACHYVHLDSRDPGGCEFVPSERGKGNVIRLRFAGAASAFTVEIEGRNLRHVWELIMGHQTPWVAEYPADVAIGGEKEAVIRSIRFVSEK